MFIGDGAKLVRDAFALAKEKQPAIIFIDELDAIGNMQVYKWFITVFMYMTANQQFFLVKKFNYAHCEEAQFVFGCSKL